jgi:hypothetical protein
LEVADVDAGMRGWVVLDSKLEAASMQATEEDHSAEEPSVSPTLRDGVLGQEPLSALLQQSHSCSPKFLELWVEVAFLAFSS